MKTMIEESFRENQRRQEMLKKQLDWKSLEATLSTKYVNDKKTGFFKTKHFSSKKEKPG